MDVFKQFATDEVQERKGVWRDIGGGARLLVARSGNRAYVKLLQSEVEKNQIALDAKGEAADDLSDKIMVGVMARTILLGWESIEFKGDTLAHSVENAEMLLGVKDFRRLVAKLSDEAEQYRLKEDTAAGEA